MTTFNTYAEYAGDDVTTDFAVPFSYEDEAEVNVTYSGGAITFIFTSPSIIQIPFALPSGETLTIDRVTPLASPDVVYANGSPFTAGQLNASVRQLLNGLQEVYDWAVNRVSGVVSIGGYTGVVTDAGVKASYENNANTNAYTDAEKSAVAGLSSTYVAKAGSTMTGPLTVSYVNPVSILNDSNGVVGGDISARTVYKANNTEVGWTGFNDTFGSMYVTSLDGYLYMTAPAAKGVITKVGTGNTVYSTGSYTQVYNTLRAAPSAATIPSLNSNYSELVVGDSSSGGGLTVLGAATSTAGIAFASPSVNAKSYISHNNVNDIFVVNNASGPLAVYADNTYTATFTNGNLGIGVTTPTEKLDVNSNKIRLRTSNTPATASSTGAAGEICWDSNYIYVCTATNTWKRAALATW